MLRMRFVSPNPHPRFRQSHSTVRFAVRVVVAIHASQYHRSHGGAVCSPGHSHVCIRDSSTRAWASVCGTAPVVRQSWQAQKGTNSKIVPMLICMHVCVYNLDIARRDLTQITRGHLAASALAIENGWGPLSLLLTGRMCASLLDSTPV